MEHLSPKKLKIERPIEMDIGDRDQIKEDAFRSIILTELTETFENNLYEAGFSDQEIRDIEGEVATLSFEDAAKVFSTPHEMAERKFKILKQRVDSGAIAAQEIPRILIEEADRHGFGIGYHNSAIEIKPDKSGAWFIRPSERDHRDDDLARAYFATTYKTLYRKGTPRFIYIVRTIAENTRTDGNWSRSGGMSVITSVPIDRVDAWVNKVLEEEEAKRKSAVTNHDALAA